MLPVIKLATAIAVSLLAMSAIRDSLSTLLQSIAF